MAAPGAPGFPPFAAPPAGAAPPLHDRLHRVARHELDVVHGEDVGGIRHRDGERAAGAAQRNDLVLARGLGRNQLDDGEVDLELRKVDRRDAVLLAEEGRDLLVFDEPQFDEAETQLPPIRLLLRQRLLELIGGDEFLLEEEFAYSDGHLGGRSLSHSDK